jgi:hypothetical protein
VLPVNDALFPSFNLLASVVRDLHASSRSRFGATVKIALRRRTFGSFSERQLGFAKFGDFLRSAESAGFVRLTQTAGGDIEVWPVGVPIPQPTPRPVRTFLAPIRFDHPMKRPFSIASSALPFTRVRQDLWNAFNSFSVSWIYDSANDIALKSQFLIAGGDNSSFISIPSGRERVVEWMKSFADIQDPETKTKLLSTLEGESSPYHFRNAVAPDIRLRKSWSRFHVQQVIAAIEAWASSNKIRPKDVVIPIGRAQGSLWPSDAPNAQASMEDTPKEEITLQPLPSPSVPVDQPVLEALTPRLLTTIDQIIDDLLKLRGALSVTEVKKGSGI